MTNKFWDLETRGYIFPDSEIIRIYHYFLKQELRLDRRKNPALLDFGCADGTNCRFFALHGFSVFGVDVLDDCILEAKRLLPEFKNNFHLVAGKPNLDQIFNRKFDLIIAISSLVYLSNTEQQRALEQMNSLLCDDGLVLFSVMDKKKNFYFRFADKTTEQDGLYRVERTGNWNDTQFLNFVDGVRDVERRFALFEKLFIGYYDLKLRFGSNFHYFFLGRKKLIKPSAG